MTHVTLTTTDGRQFGTAGFCNTHDGSSWAWVCERVAAWFGCHINDVDTTDTDDALDLLTVRGAIVGRMDYRYN